MRDRLPWPEPSGRGFFILESGLAASCRGVIGGLCPGRYAAMQSLRLRITGAIVETSGLGAALPVTHFVWRNFNLGGPPLSGLFSFPAVAQTLGRCRAGRTVRMLLTQAILILAVAAVLFLGVHWLEPNHRLALVLKLAILAVGTAAIAHLLH